jgi:hypothetical protein
MALSSAVLPGKATAETSTDYKALAQSLRAGGLNILVRHGATNSNQADTDPFHFADISKQRNLSEKGKKLAHAFGGENQDACASTYLTISAPNHHPIELKITEVACVGNFPCRWTWIRLLASGSEGLADLSLNFSEDSFRPITEGLTTKER